MWRKNAAGSSSGGTLLCTWEAAHPAIYGRTWALPSCVTPLVAMDYVEVFAKAECIGQTLVVEGGAVTDSIFKLVKLF